MQAKYNPVGTHYNARLRLCSGFTQRPCNCVRWIAAVPLHRLCPIIRSRWQSTESPRAFSYRCPGHFLTADQLLSSSRTATQSSLYQSLSQTRRLATCWCQRAVRRLHLLQSSAWPRRLQAWPRALGPSDGQSSLSDRSSAINDCTKVVALRLFLPRRGCDLREPWLCSTRQDSVSSCPSRRLRVARVLGWHHPTNNPSPHLWISRCCCLLACTSLARSYCGKITSRWLGRRAWWFVRASSPARPHPRTVHRLWSPVHGLWVNMRQLLPDGTSRMMSFSGRMCPLTVPYRPRTNRRRSRSATSFQWTLGRPTVSMMS